MKVILSFLFVFSALPVYGEFAFLRRKIVKNCKSADGQVHVLTAKFYSDGDRSMTVDGQHFKDDDEARFRDDKVFDAEGNILYSECELVSEESFSGGRDDAGG